MCMTTIELNAKQRSIIRKLRVFLTWVNDESQMQKGLLVMTADNFCNFYIDFADVHWDHCIDVLNWLVVHKEGQPHLSLARAELICKNICEEYTGQQLNG